MTSNYRTLAWLCLATASSVWAQDPGALETPLERAGPHRATLEAALAEAPAAQQPGLRFLIEHMPLTDLESLPKKFILEHLAYAYRAWNAAPWKDLVPEEIFLNNLLPYASINERRDRWRKDFYERFAPLVATAKTPAEAAAILNQKIFGMLGVKYSTKRPKADQSPYESIEAGAAGKAVEVLGRVHVDPSIGDRWCSEAVAFELDLMQELRSFVGRADDMERSIVHRYVELAITPDGRCMDLLRGELLVPEHRAISCVDAAEFAGVYGDVDAVADQNR